MKAVLLEILAILQAVALWTFALPAAATLFGLALVWNKAAGSVSAFPPAGARISRASA